MCVTVCPTSHKLTLVTYYWSSLSCGSSAAAARMAAFTKSSSPSLLPWISSRARSLVSRGNTLTVTARFTLARLSALEGGRPDRVMSKPWKAAVEPRETGPAFARRKPRLTPDTDTHVLPCVCVCEHASCKLSRARVHVRPIFLRRDDVATLETLETLPRLCLAPLNGSWWCPTCRCAARRQIMGELTAH